MLCTWVAPTIIIIFWCIGIVTYTPPFTLQAKSRAEELGVSHRVHFIHHDASDYISDKNVI